MITDLSAARATAEATLLDTCSVIRAGGDATLNRTTGQLSAPAPITIWSGPCSATIGPDRLTNQYGDDRELTAAIVRVPVTATGIKLGDVVTVTAVHGDGDPTLVGQPMTIFAVDGRTHIVLRRLSATLVTEDTENVIR